ncbi:MAG: L-lactate permease, partial [Anaerolineales bacterium]|nr:L-lactate permease [Anaerolineales bacterium]
MPLTIGNWLLAIIPVLVVIILMLVFKWSGKQAGAGGLLVAIGIGMLFFGAGIELIAYTQVKAILLSLDVLYIIWAALLLYNIANEAGAIKMIGERLPRLTSDKVIQTLLIGWLLVSFLQGMGGFGVPVAICAPLLVGMGFGPVQAVVMASLGHAWAVNFGSLATAFQSLMAVTGLPGEMLAPASALMLGIVALPCGMIVAFIGCGWKGLKRGLPAILILSGVMGVVQYLLATNGLWTLGATGAAIAGLLTCLLLLKLPMYKNETQTVENSQSLSSDKPKSFLLTLSAYVILVLLAFGTMLIPVVRNFLSQVKVTLPFPELATSRGWVTPAETGRAINLFGHPGAILLYTSIISSVIYWRSGYFKPGAMKRIFAGVGKSAVTASLGIIT